MDNRYWIDDDGYITHGTGDDYITIAEIIKSEHIEPLSQILTAVPDLLEACKKLVNIFPEYSMSELDACDFKDRAHRIWTAIESVKNILIKIEGN